MRKETWRGLLTRVCQLLSPPSAFILVIVLLLLQICSLQISCPVIVWYVPQGKYHPCLIIFDFVVPPKDITHCAEGVGAKVMSSSKSCQVLCILSSQWKMLNNLLVNFHVKVQSVVVIFVFVVLEIEQLLLAFALSCITSPFYFYLETGCKLHRLGLNSRSSCFSPLSSWDYMHVPLHPAHVNLNRLILLNTHSFIS